MHTGHLAPPAEKLAKSTADLLRRRPAHKPARRNVPEPTSTCTATRPHIAKGSNRLVRCPGLAPPLQDECAVAPAPPHHELTPSRRMLPCNTQSPTTAPSEAPCTSTHQIQKKRHDSNHHFVRLSSHPGTRKTQNQGCLERGASLSHLRTSIGPHLWHKPPTGMDTQAQTTVVHHRPLGAACVREAAEMSHSQKSSMLCPRRCCHRCRRRRPQSLGPDVCAGALLGKFGLDEADHRSDRPTRTVGHDAEDHLWANRPEAPDLVHFNINATSRELCQ